MGLRIVCISDTHGMHRGLHVPGGDAFICAGDFLRSGLVEELEEFNDWVGELPHPRKIVIAGNHDWCLQKQPMCAALLTNAEYLCDSGTMLNGLHVWGSPWQPRFFDWAFNLDRGEKIAEKWALIPEDTDILITHGPPFGVLDVSSHNVRIGCEDLAHRVDQVQPMLHVFGHNHAGHGVQQRTLMTSVNACICDEKYRPRNPAISVGITAFF